MSAPGEGSSDKQTDGQGRQTGNRTAHTALKGVHSQQRAAAHNLALGVNTRATSWLGDLLLLLRD